MDAADAKQLLGQIEEIKSADFSGLAGYLPSFGSNPATEQAAQQIQQMHNSKLQGDAAKTILKTLLVAGGLGAAVRGYTGLTNMSDSKKRKPVNRVVEMPVSYPEKQADNAKATSMIGLDYFAPAMLLGAPLAAYGGWKGVDAILNKQREKEVDSDLDRAKAEYEQALLGSYKKATDEALDAAFGSYTKQANMITDGLSYLSDSISPNLSGATKGLGLAYALATAPLGYHLVNRAMKKNSKRALLQKAIEERARRQAKAQPPEIYAVPTPVEPEQA